jgi:adenylosuccinate synthase
MPNIVVVGMQWGDEGKGKIVDLLCPAFDAVVRYQGGHNAGHTVRFADRHFSLHLIPSGILHEGMRCYLGNGMVLSPGAFLKELDGLRQAGVQIDGRLFVSDRAQVIVPGLEALDAAREARLGDGKIGTTARGIGPAYELKAARIGLRVCELVAGPRAFGERLGAQLERLEWELRALGTDTATVWPGGRPVLEDALARYGEALRPFACDVSRALAETIDRGESVLFEGAQGTLLDIDFGTYPFVTSSSATAGGACTGSGVPPQRIDGVIGILKAYSTRVGGGPFVTELGADQPLGEHLRRRGNEYGTTTGRPRRCGWLDLPVARYARRLSGVGTIALTKLDVLDELDELLICEAYEIDGGRTAELPADVALLARARPVYRTVPGWRTSTVGQLDYRKLPRAAREYVELIEERLEIPVDLLSTGPRREETIVRDAALGPWLGERAQAISATA